MKSVRFKSSEAKERHEAKANKALNKWLETYTIEGMSVGKDKDGNVVQLQFNRNRTDITEVVSNKTDDVFVDATGKRHKTIPTKKKGKGCSGCQKKAQNRLKRFVTGGAKLLKSELGIDAASEDTILKRKQMCESCDLYDFGVCDESKGGCGCFVAAKVKLNSEKCPLDKWAAIEVTTDGN